MREDWISCAIGDVVEQVKRAQSVNDDEEYRLLGVRWYGMGAFHRETVTTATSKANKLFRVHTGDFIYNRLFAWKGSFAVIEDELGGCFVSGEFPVFRTDPERLVPEYLFHYMARPQIWDRILLESTGSTATSRNRWKEDRFLSMEIDLPPVNEQRRIVDLISSIDHAIQFGVQYADGLTDARRQILSQLLEPKDGWAKSTLGDLLSLEYGKRLVEKERDGSGYPVYGSSGVLGKHSTPLVESAPWIVVGRKGTAGSVMLSDTPGWPIDTTYWVRMKANNLLVEYGYLLLQASDLPAICAQTGVPGLNRDRVYAIAVAIPAVLEQRRIVELVSSVDENLEHLRRHIAACESLRSQILEDLLSGTHEVPDSYDRFLEDAS